jgi:16S rRNA (uracil1498-N3)-methyltransferase
MVTIELERTVVAKALEINDSIFVTKDELGRGIDAAKTASQTGEHIGVIDADDNYYEVRVLHASDAGASFCVTQRKTGLVGDDALAITVAQSACEPEAMKTIVRGTTELGASELVPLVTRHSRSVAALEWQRLDTLVMKTSLLAGRDCQPRFQDPVTIDEALDRIDRYDLVVVYWERATDDDQYDQKLSDLVQRSVANDSTMHIALVFGPEGGLADDEVAKFMDAGDNVVCASLGPTVLSCDTAAITAMTLVQSAVRRLLDSLR